MIDPVKDEDSIQDIARKIFNDFELNQSCTVRGFIEQDDELIPKGLMVVKELERLDVAKNWYTAPGESRKRRKRLKLANTIGGFVAQKIFRYEQKIVNKDMRYSFWRIQ